MYIRPSAPRTIGGVLDDAIRLYRASFSSVWPLTVVAAILIAIPGIFLSAQMAHPGQVSPQAALAMMKSPVIWSSYLLIMLVYLVIYGALISALSEVVTRGRASVSGALGVGMREAPRMVAVGFLLSLMVMVGIVLFVIPGIYLWGVFQLAFVALIVDDLGITESLGRSRRLIKGHWWRSATILTVAFIILLVFSILGGVLNGVAAGMLHLRPGAVVVNQSIIGAVVNACLLPFLPSVLLTMYYDLKLRNEGTDLSARVGALAAR